MGARARPYESTFWAESTYKTQLLQQFNSTKPSSFDNSTCKTRLFIGTLNPQNPPKERVQGRGERSRWERTHLGSGSGGRGQGQPKKNLLKILVVANYMRQVLQIERHFDLGRGLRRHPSTVSPSLRDILPKRLTFS